MHFYHLILVLLLSLRWHAAAQVEEQGQAEEPAQAEGLSPEATPEHLFDTGNCPTAPKLQCADPACRGFLGIIGEFDQFTCASQSPSTTLGRPAVAFRCPCCPGRHHTTCIDSLCDAAPGTRTCRGAALRDCACMTNEDNAAVAVRPLPVQSAAAFPPWRNPVAYPPASGNIHRLWRELLDIRRERGLPDLPLIEDLLRRMVLLPSGNGTAAPNETVVPGVAGEVGPGNGTEGGASGGARPAGDQVSSAFGRLPTGVGYIAYGLRKM